MPRITEAPKINVQFRHRIPGTPEEVAWRGYRRNRRRTGQIHRILDLIKYGPKSQREEIIEYLIQEVDYSNNNPWRTAPLIGAGIGAGSSLLQQGYYKARMKQEKDPDKKAALEKKKKKAAYHFIPRTIAGAAAGKIVAGLPTNPLVGIASKLQNKWVANKVHKIKHPEDVIFSDKKYKRYGLHRIPGSDEYPVVNDVRIINAKRLSSGMREAIIEGTVKSVVAKVFPPGAENFYARNMGQGAILGGMAGSMIGGSIGGHQQKYNAAIGNMRRRQAKYENDVKRKKATHTDVEMPAGVTRIKNRGELKAWTNTKGNIHSNIPVIGTPIKRFATRQILKTFVPSEKKTLGAKIGNLFVSRYNAGYRAPDTKQGTGAVFAHKLTPAETVKHELGHAKDFAGLTTKGIDKHFKDDAYDVGYIKSRFGGYKDNPTYKSEVRAWDLGGVPANHPERKHALASYQHSHEQGRKQRIGKAIGSAVGAGAGYVAARKGVVVPNLFDPSIFRSMGVGV